MLKCDTMLRLICILFFAFLSLNALAHSGYIKGTVGNKNSNEPLVGANVYFREISTGITTDVFGNFHFTLKPGSYHVEISYVGFKTIVSVIEIRLHETTLLNIELEEGAVQLADLVIAADPVAQDINRLSQLDIALRPVASSQEVLRMVPGLFIAQHAGGGKAEQMFLRGFDLDHGTDIKIDVDGMPVNMVSHAHGQGYADLHFLIPETIEFINLNKGPYDANAGNFATAGGIGFHTIDLLKVNSVKVEGGSFGFFRNVNLLRLLDVRDSANRQQLYLATEALRSDGYFESPQGFHRLNLLTKYFVRKKDNELFEISLSGFSSQWNASGQIPERAVTNKTISRFGAIDDGEGGATSRFNLNASWDRKVHASFLKQQLFASHYTFDLLSNFTFYLNDPSNGDRIRQQEKRNIFGYQAEMNSERQLHKADLTHEYGLSIRYDNISDLRLSQVSADNQPIALKDAAAIGELNLATYTEHQISFPAGWIFTAGLRYDVLSFHHRDRLRNNIETTRTKGLLSPKLRVAYQMSPLTTLFIKAGYGFHTNDTRAVTVDATIPLTPRAFGMDAGVKWKPFPKLYIESSLWMLDVEQELVYVGDEGIVEPSEASRRKGVDVSFRYQVSGNFFADANVNYAVARWERYEGSGKYIPLAPSLTSNAGIQYQGERCNAAIRYRYLGDRPANEDYSLTAEGYLLLDVNASYDLNRITLGVSVENLFNEEWKEAQFETTSRLKDEPAPVSEIHFTPGMPRSVKAVLKYKF
jgi:hypothetical protein